jgi:predicted metal-binding membrane protein
MSVGLLLAIAAAWGLVVFGPDGMGMGMLAFVAAWTVMMAAMMLPSAAPLVLLYRRGASARATLLLVAGYLIIWAAAGVPAYLALELLPMTNAANAMDGMAPNYTAPIALAVAGLYQLTPLKTVCLRHCRSPADFLVQHWGRGALRLGLQHGLWCLGCCWALMAVLVIVGMMGMVWVVGLAALVAIEKLSAHGLLLSRLTGVAFLIAAIVGVFP